MPTLHIAADGVTAYLSGLTSLTTGGTNPETGKTTRVEITENPTKFTKTQIRLAKKAAELTDVDIVIATE